MWVSVHYPHSLARFLNSFVSYENNRGNPHLVIAGVWEYGEGIDFREGKIMFFCLVNLENGEKNG